MRTSFRLLLGSLLLRCLGELLAAGPDNNAFANRTILQGTDTVMPVYLLDATQEPGEPNHAPSPLVSSASIWWEWTAPAEGFLTLTSLAGQPQLAVYRGDSLAGLELQARSQELDGRIPAIPMKAGGTVFIAASFWGPADSSWVFTPTLASAHLQFHPLPANDLFADRIRLVGTRVRLSGHTLGATREPGEPEVPWISNHPTVWWEWTPPVSGLATYRSVTSSGGLLQAYRGTNLASLERLGDLLSGSPFPVTAGEPIQFSMTGSVPPGDGPVELVVSVSSLRIASPISGTRLAEPGPLVLTLENLPPGLDHLVVLPGGTSFPVSAQLTVPRIEFGSTRLSVVGVSSEGDLYHSPEVTVLVQAGDDVWASAPMVPENPALLGGDFASATVETGEPALPSVSGAGSVWWRWRAPAAGRVMAGQGSLPNGSPVAIVEFFTGDTLNSLQAVPQALGPGRPNLNTEFYADAGKQYWIRLTRAADLPADWASLQFEFQPLVEGDSRAQAVALTSGNFEQVLVDSYSTVEPGEPGPDLPDVGSRWFAFTPPSDGLWALSLENVWNVESQSSLMVFDSPGLEASVALSGPALNLSVPVTRGIPLFLRVATPNYLPSTLPLTVRARFTVPPANDALATAEVLAGEAGERVGSNDLGTLEPGENPNEAGDRTVWYRFTAPEAGALRIRVQSTSDSVFRHHVRLRFAQGDSVSSLSWPGRQVFEEDWSIIELESGESVLAVVGNTVFGEPGPTGFHLEHQFEARPTNDAWNRASDLGVLTSVSVRGTNWLASREPDEPAVGGGSAGRTVWWRWTAPASGLLEVEARGLLVGVFTGDSLAALKAVVSADPPGSVLGGMRIPVVAGTGYWIAVDRRGAAGTPQISGAAGFELNLRLGSLQLNQPMANSVVMEGTPLTFSVRPAVPTLDGEWTSVTYRAVVVRFGVPTVTNLATVAAPPFEAADLRLPAGWHQVQAVATNAEGGVFFSPVVALRVSPPHDDFARAEVLTGRYLTNGVTWSGATQEAGEPSGPTSLQGTLWYRWTAPATGNLRVAPPAGTLFTLYTGTELTSLKAQPVTGGLASRFLVQAGTEYRGRLATPLTAVGVASSGVLRWELTTAEWREPGEDALFAAGEDVTLLLETTELEGSLARVHFLEGADRIATVTAPPWRFVWPQPTSGRHQVVAQLEMTSGDIFPVAARTFRVGPGNDRFTNRVVLAGTSGQEPSNTLGSTPEHPGDTSGDIWFGWTAPANGLFRIRSVGLGGFVRTALYTGTTMESLQEVPNRLDTGGGFGRGEWDVTAGITYHLIVAQANADSDSTPFDLVWEFVPPTSNDDFARRLTLEGESGEVLANVVQATLEAGEPDYGSDYPVIASVWWTLTPPRDGVLEISFPDDNAPANSVRPMVGSTLTGLRPLQAIGNPPVFQGQPRLYRVDGGVPLSLVYVSGLNNRNDLRWTWRLLPLPANDSMAEAAVLEGTSVSVPGSTLGASHEPGEPFPSENLFNTVWWRWKAPADGDLQLTLRGLRINHSVAMFRGSTPQAGTFLLSGSVSASEVPNVLFLRVAAGETYQILVGPTEGVGQSFILDLWMRLRPANDDFAQRQRVEGTQWTVEGANWLSTREFREPLHHGRFGGRSVWYAWRAPADGDVTLQLAGEYSQFKLLAAYEGDRVDQLTEVGSVEVGDRNAPLRFVARAGRDYALALDGVSGDASNFQLTLQMGSEPPAPALALLPLGDQGIRLTTSALPPGEWGLEESFDLRDWFPVMNLQPSGPKEIDLFPDTRQPAIFYRVRRQD